MLEMILSDAMTFQKGLSLRYVASVRGQADVLCALFSERSTLCRVKTDSGHSFA